MPNIKYFRGKFVTADNRIATSNNQEILNNKYLYYWMLSHINLIADTYRGASIKHPSMNDILNLDIQLPKIEEQKKIEENLSQLDQLITLHQQELK